MDADNVKVAAFFFYHTVDEYGHRLHTNLTNLSKVLRGHVKIKGKYISGVDVSNCQPYLSGKYLTDPEATKDYFPGNFPFTMLKCLRSTEQQDVKKFLLLTAKAELYQYLEREFNKRGLYYIRDKEKGVDELKDKIFQIFFDKNNHTSKEKKIFQELFLNVDRAFSVLRMDDYKNFNSGLTRLESHLILDVILERLNNEFPDMVATQIYNNVTTSIATNDIETVQRVMTEELNKFMGYPPVLKVENFGRPHFLTSKSLFLPKNKIRRMMRRKGNGKYSLTVLKSLKSAEN